MEVKKFIPYKRADGIKFSGLYPINEKLKVLADPNALFPNVVEYGGIETNDAGEIINGKYTSNSYIDAYTLNLVIDNFNTLIYALEKTPNNVDPLQFINLFSVSAYKDTIMVRDDLGTTEINDPLINHKIDAIDKFPENPTLNGDQVSPEHIQITGVYKSPNYDYINDRKVLNVHDLITEEYFRREEDIRLFKSIGRDYYFIQHFDARIEKDLAIRDAAIASRAIIHNTELTGIPKSPTPEYPGYYEPGITDFTAKAPQDQVVNVHYMHKLTSTVIGKDCPPTLTSIIAMARAMGGGEISGYGPDLKGWTNNQISLLQTTTPFLEKLPYKVDIAGGEHYNAILSGRPTCPPPQL